MSEAPTEKANAVSEGMQAIQRAMLRWVGEPDPEQTFWGQSLPAIDRMDRQFNVLSETQRDRLDELRQRIEYMTPRESAYVTGLLTQCLGVASAESEGDA